MNKYNIYEFQQFFKSKQDLSKDYLIEKYFKNNKEIENLQSQLQSYKAKEDKLREYITSYESISIIQGLNDTTKNKDLDENTMIEMTNRYLEVHDKLLEILNEGE